MIEELKPAAISLAHELAAQPAKAVESMMKVLGNSSDRELEVLLKAERQAVKDNSGTKDSQEGMAAFMEKENPYLTNKKMKKFIKVISIIIVICFVFVIFITRDGEVITPIGEGVVRLDIGDFEAFPLPDYALNMINSDYKSYFVEVEPGIKVHVLDVGQGLPVFLMHGNPTSGFLYRKVVENLPLDRVRVIMPTSVGLGFSSKVPASQHTLDNHIRWINETLNQLQISEVVYAGQDWGGPIGMGALALSPDVLKGAVILNTGFNAPSISTDLSPAHALVKTPVVGEFILEVVFSIFERLGGVQETLVLGPRMSLRFMVDLCMKAAMPKLR